MDRRIWIKQITICGAAILLMPACINKTGPISATLKNISLTWTEEDLLAQLAEIIIPETNTPGAKTLKIPQFLLTMIDDCYDQTEQQMYLNGLRQLDQYSKRHNDIPFLDLGWDKKLNLLRAINKSNPKEEDLTFFLKETRHLVIRGYNTSAYFMTKVIPYEMIPGRFNGCVKVKKAKNV
ncbi:gluconate 2-dehydrogenase subunit 3 family protein [Pedobacter frigiditerrae]|uniref:Gluconate 2-dehydrogenase subunit 3 family protein n=1 Tax=Pedobacter frigiditerrae TaxID=2530452 RepID=A0A4R0MPD0_9SPHI|nr:gluconate 2-dehydrogenase subunit 3 family protein [Pedobacter frigiditerrae]TCC88688.1 gluconate 2-dehydrogenase subunit 3 family protein [Pedobacter frigiditerrae]